MYARPREVGRGRGVASLPCPICGRLFSADAIAEHADSCAERMEKVNRPKAPSGKSIAKRRDRSAEQARARDRPAAAGASHRAAGPSRRHAAKVAPEPSFYIPANLDSSIVTDVVEGLEFRAQSSLLHPRRQLPPPQQPPPPQPQPPRDAFVGDHAANGKQPMHAQHPPHPSQAMFGQAAAPTPLFGQAAAPKPFCPPGGGGGGCAASCSASCTATGGATLPSDHPPSWPTAMSEAAPVAPLPPAPKAAATSPSGAGRGPASEAEPPAGRESSKAPAPTSEAERFLAKVRELFADDAEKQQRFTQVMRGFFLDELDTPDVMEAMAEMLQGHWALLRQFNRFLPEDFRIEQLPPHMSGYHVCHLPEHGPVSHDDAAGLASQFFAKLYKRFEHSPKLHTLLRALLEIPGDTEGFGKYSASPLQLIEHIRPILQTKEHEDLWREFQQYMPKQAQGHVMVAHDAPSQ